MNTYYAQATGNINDASMWNTAADGSGTTLTWPCASDDVLVANGKTVAVNISIACGEIKTLSTTKGGFTISVNALTIQASITGSDTAVCLTATHTGTGSNKLTIGSSGTPVTLSGGSGYQPYGLKNSSSGEILIYGNCVAGTAGPAVYNGSAGKITVNGNITGRATGGNGGNGFINNTTGEIIVNGDVTSGANYSCNGLQNNSTGKITVNGNVYGPPDATTGVCCGIANANSNAEVIINGNVINTNYGTAISGRFSLNASYIIQQPYDTTAGHVYNYAKEPAASDIKKDVVVGTVTGTLEANGGGPLIGSGGLVG